MRCSASPRVHCSCRLVLVFARCRSQSEPASAHQARILATLFSSTLLQNAGLLAHLRSMNVAKATLCFPKSVQVHGKPAIAGARSMHCYSQPCWLSLKNFGKWARPRLCCCCKSRAFLRAVA